MRNNTLFIFNLYINLESLPIEWVVDFFVEEGNVCVLVAMEFHHFSQKS